MTETPNWQAAPELYGWIFNKEMPLISDLLKNEDYEGAYDQIYLIYAVVAAPIESKDDKLAKEIELKREDIEKAIGAYYSHMMENDSTGNALLDMGKANFDLRNSLKQFLKLLFKGAYYANLLIPTKEVDIESGARKFARKYIKGEKGEINENE